MITRNMWSRARIAASIHMHVDDQAQKADAASQA
jgi:hypothetical protein